MKLALDTLTFQIQIKYITKSRDLTLSCEAQLVDIVDVRNCELYRT